MAEITTFSIEEPRETRQELSSLHPEDRDGLDVSVVATSGGGRNSTVPSACADTGSGARESDPTIRYVPCPDATSEAEVETLARIYDFVIGAYKSREAAGTANRDEGEQEAGQGHTEGHAPEKGKL
jgi:hypothetical protein